jgi:dTMP kinase
VSVTEVDEPTSALRIPTFRRLWWGLSSSSFGDWLGLLALTAMANQMVEGYAAKNYAIAGVLFLRVMPALVIGPLAGYVADHVDRRTVLIWGDHVRGLLFLSIPLIGQLWWVFVVTVLIEAVSLVWGPAKDATVPNLVPSRLLEGANAVSTAATYGSAVPAAAFFAALTSLDRLAPGALGWAGGAVDVSLVVNGVTFIVSGLIIATLRDLPRGPAHGEGRGNVLGAVLQGWGYVFRTRVVRGLVTGMVGAFAAGGVVVGLARTHVSDLGGGDAGYGLLFGAVFTGMGLGIWRGTRLLRRLDRRQVFGAALVGCGATLVPLALVPHLEIVAGLAVVVGFLAGTAWINGMTLLGLEVPDHLRGRTFAFVGSAVRLTLGLVLALGPLAAGAIGRVSLGGPPPDPGVTYAGAAVTIMGAALLLVAVGVVSYRLMHDHEGRAP